MRLSRGTVLAVALLVLAGLLGGCRTGRDAGTFQVPPDLADTAWELDTLNGRDLIEGTHITLFFGEEHLGGSMTCNGYGGGPDSGSYTATEGGSMTVPQLAVTLQLCSEPQGIMEQESAYVDALLGAATYQVDGDRLQIADGTGEAVLVYARQEG
jgi:heat shock protein HslJ